MEWQPIETAPRDRTVIDLWGYTPLSGTSYEFRGKTHVRPAGERRSDVMWCPVHRVWRVAKDTHFGHELYDFTPTHWAPITPPNPTSP